VIELNLSNLSKFYRRNEVWVILFYKPEDRESQELKDMYRELASKYYGIFKVAAVNCEEDEEICDGEFEVREFPKVLVLSSDSNREPFNYRDEYRLEKIASFAASKMESYAQFVSEEGYQEFVNS